MRSVVPRVPAPHTKPKEGGTPFDKLHPVEKKLIIDGLKVSPQPSPVPFTWTDSFFRFAAISDSHIGHKLSYKKWWDTACSRIEATQCDLVFHVGDLTEGMSSRPGHVYELEAIGATAQIELTALRLQQIQAPIYAITGNHDLWGYKSIGHDPGVELAKRVSHFHYLGQNEAVHEIAGINIMLSHPGDGSAFSISYAAQQFINALSGGEKPNILLMGHHHKSIYFNYRNVAAFEVGCLCAQTSFMRGKRIPAHAGFWVVEVWPNTEGIERIRTEWIPFF